MTTFLARRDPDAALALFRGETQPLLLVRRRELTANVLRRAALRDRPWEGDGSTAPTKRAARIWPWDHMGQ